MTERVVDALEFVDIDVEHRELTAAPDTLKFQFEPFAEQGAVWQVGQCVVVGKVSNLLLGYPSLRDVFVRRHPSAVLGLFVRDLHPAPVSDGSDVHTL